MTIHTDPADFRPPEPKRRRWPGLLAAAGIFVVGIVVGGVSATDPQPEPTAKAEPVEVEVPGPTVTITPEPVVETVEVEVTSASCAEAIRLAYFGFDLAGQALTSVSEAIEAAAAYDVAGIEQEVRDFDVINTRLTDLAPMWQEHATACEEG